MLNWIGKLAFFLCAYVPLFGILGAQEYIAGHKVEAFCTWGLGLFGLAVTGSTMISNSRLSPRWIKIQSAIPSSSAYVIYIVTYLLPYGYLMVEDWSEVKVGLMWSYVAILGFIHLRADLFYANPVLAALGYKIYQITTDEKITVFLLSKKRVLPGDRIQVWSIAEEIQMATPHLITMTPQTSSQMKKELAGEEAELEAELA